MYLLIDIALINTVVKWFNNSGDFYIFNSDMRGFRNEQKNKNHLQC